MVLLEEILLGFFGQDKEALVSVEPKYEATDDMMLKMSFCRSEKERTDHALGNDSGKIATALKSSFVNV